MKLVAVGGPLHDLLVEIPDSLPRSVPWFALEKRRDVAPLLDMPLNELSLDLDAPIKHAYYRTVVGRREYLIHNPQRCGCVL